MVTGTLGNGINKGSWESVGTGAGNGSLTDADIVDPVNGTAFAVYSEDDHSLMFYKRRGLPKVGVGLRTSPAFRAPVSTFKMLSLIVRNLRTCISTDAISQEPITSFIRLCILDPFHLIARAGMYGLMFCIPISMPARLA